MVATARMLVLFGDLAESRASLVNSAQETNPPESNQATCVEKSVLEAVVKSPLGKALEEVSGTLSDIRTRAYIDVGRVDRSLSLLYSLLKDASGTVRQTHLSD